MSLAPLFLVTPETQKLLESWRLTGPATVERLIIFGAIGFVALVLALGVVLLRKKRRRRRHHHAHQSFSRPAEMPKSVEDENVSAPPVRGRHRRHSRHRHRPRNPTLAETGGLPPIRAESPPAPEP